MIRRSIWKKLPFDTETPHIEDRLWAKKLVEKGFSIAYEPGAAVFHHHGINHHSDLLRAESISDILVKNTMANGTDYPAFLSPEKESILFCLLGHDESLTDQYLLVINKLAQKFSNGRVMVNSVCPEALENSSASLVRKLPNEDHFTFCSYFGQDAGYFKAISVLS